MQQKMDIMFSTFKQNSVFEILFKVEGNKIK